MKTTISKAMRKAGMVKGMEAMRILGYKSRHPRRTLEVVHHLKSVSATGGNRWYLKSDVLKAKEKRQQKEAALIKKTVTPKQTELFPCAHKLNCILMREHLRECHGK